MAMPQVSTSSPIASTSDLGARTARRMLSLMLRHGGSSGRLVSAGSADRIGPLPALLLSTSFAGCLPAFLYSVRDGTDVRFFVVTALFGPGPRDGIVPDLHAGCPGILPGFGGPGNPRSGLVLLLDAGRHGDRRMDVPAQSSIADPLLPSGLFPQRLCLEPC